MNIRSILGLTVLFIPGTASAHEYWLDPVDSSITRGSPAIIDVRNGENFAGSAFPFDNSKFAAVSVNSKTSSAIYEGRLGDYPAIHPELEKDGRHSINLNSKPELLIYKSWEQFVLL